jgi:uncharacterized protein (TIGR02265 family)
MAHANAVGAAAQAGQDEPMPAPPGFVPVDWSAPFDPVAHIAACPAEFTIKGVIAHGVVRRLERGGYAPAGRYSFQTFKDYPLREHLELVVDAARLMHPDQPLREALRRLGRVAYDDVLETLIGRVVFGVLGKNFPGIVRLSAKAYEIVGSRARVTMVAASDGFAHSHIKDAFGFLDTYQIGVYEGTMAYCGHVGEVLIKRHSISEAEVWCEWR